MNWIDRIPLRALIILALFGGLAPFYPEPHLWEKLKMLIDGTLVRPIDIFDLFFHAAAPMLLLIKFIRIKMHGKKAASD